MFDWDRNNLRKIRAHRIGREEVEQALTNDPVFIQDQDAEDENRFLYYGESDSGRLLAVVVTPRGAAIRVVTSYDLAARQRRSYLEYRSSQGEHNVEEKG